MNPRRLYAPVVLATLAAGGVAFFATGRTWASERIATDGLPSDNVAATGADAHPLVSALALVVVAAALAVLAASPRVRRGVGVLTAVVALIALWTVVTGRDGLDEALANAAEASPAYTGSATDQDVSRTSWHLLAAASFAVAAVLGAVTARWGGVWPSMSSRYDAPAAHPTPTTPQSDADMWKAMDEGQDPTQ